MIPGWLYTGAFYGLLGCALLAVLYYVYRPKRGPDRLPRAELAANRWRRRMLPWLPRLALVGGLFGAWLLSRTSVDVIHVRDVDGGPSVERKKHVGEPDFTLAPGQTQRDLVIYDTWVYNESARPVRIETISYSSMALGWGPADPIVIAPGTAAITVGIEHFGPDDQPPSTVRVEGFAAKVGVTSRSWLTWDQEPSAPRL